MTKSQPMEQALNYYQLLSLQQRQSADVLSSHEVKTAYKRALLQHHPDKQRGSSVAKLSKNARPSSVTVDDIALAYKVLSEPSLRAEYDRWLFAKDSKVDTDNRVHRTGLETVDLDDLLFEPTSSTWSRSCRCGDEKGFVVTESELENNAEDGELIVGCKGCSLWLRVLFGVEEG
jgi:diphthamide biosynthesis protein 4